MNNQQIDPRAALYDGLSQNGMPQKPKKPGVGETLGALGKQVGGMALSMGTSMAMMKLFNALMGGR